MPGIAGIPDAGLTVYVRRGPVHDMGAAAGTATVLLQITNMGRGSASYYLAYHPETLLGIFSPAACMVGE
jgi:hypothetical protein